MNDLLWLIPGAPILGALVIGIFGQQLPAKVCSFFATLMALVSAIAVFFLWLNGGVDAHFHEDLYTWMAVGLWNPHLSLSVDKVSMVMLSVATWVGFLIHLYSVRFIGGEYGERRYFFYLNLFIAGMIFFVMADNLILLYLGWEVMGLCSYALVSYYFHKQYYAFCGRKAFVVTRIGDTALAIAIIFAFAHFGTVNMPDIFQQVQTQQPSYFLIGALCILFLLAGIAKSAQFPMHIWLPDAMTGPSTVSALIHAATMVTAGVYLLVRFHPLLNIVPDVRLIVAFVGCITAFFAASAALAQNEIKRVLAYSTVSQIGYMFAAVGVGAYSLALFHLIVHACFKALLFMSSGAIVNAFNGVSDIRDMGGLAKSQPLLNVVYLIGSLTLAALPLVTASFYSKDAIIAADFTSANGYFLAFLGFAGALFTGLYAMRMYFMVFLGQARSEIKQYQLPFSMKLPLVILAFFSVTIGWIQFPDDWHFGPHLLVPWLSSVVGWNPMPSASVSFWLEVIGSAVSLIGIVVAYPIVKKELTRKHGLGNNAFLNNAWYIDQLSRYIIVIPYYVLSWISHMMIEKLFFNKAIVGSVTGLLSLAHTGMKEIQSGALQRYLYLMVLGVVLLLVYAVWLFT